MVTSVRKTCVDVTIRAVKWLPVLVSAVLFGWSYYAYTFQVVFICMQDTIQKIACFIIFHLLYILSLWSYIQTIFTLNGKIPQKFYLQQDITTDLNTAPTEQQRDQILLYVVRKNNLPVSCRTYSGSIRYCEKCNIIKPDRCHHCSVCGTCVLRMDHHCPWINNCVSFTNHKFFVLFLGYTFALCLFVGATTLPYFFAFWNSPLNNNQSSSLDSPNSSGTTLPADLPFSARFHILFLFFVSFMLMFGVMSLYCYHMHLVLNNRSTLESFRPPLMTYGPDKNAFNLGKNENVNQIFGRNKCLWLMPLFTTEGSGVFYDQRRQLNQGDEEVRQELLKPQSININMPTNTDTEV